MGNFNLKSFFKTQYKDKAGLNESKSKILTQLINNSIETVDDSLSYKDLAKAISSIIKNEYGSHIIKPFIDTLYQELNDYEIGDGEDIQEDSHPKIKKELFSKLKNTHVNYFGKPYLIKNADEFTVTLEDEQGKIIRVNYNMFNKSGFIREFKETIQLGKQLDEDKLCKRGRDYIKARKRAGEKSSAYLSGRAVRVCKGQIKFKGKKRDDYD